MKPFKIYLPEIFMDKIAMHGYYIAEIGEKQGKKRIS